VSAIVACRPATTEHLLPLRATRAIIDLDAIAGNVRALRRHLPPTTRLMAVVKADAYGHGAPWVSRTALEAGASLLGVATVGEGLALRAEGLTAPIVLLGSIDAGEAEAAVRGGLEITVASVELLEAVQAAVRRRSAHAPAGIHLKVDTGLRRYGAAPELVARLARRVVDDPMLKLGGLCTHFASSDEPAEDAFTDAQLIAFHEVLASLVQAGIPLPPRHVANSAAVLRQVGTECEIARPGIALYGLPPSNEVSLLPGMRPAMRIESRITRIIPISAGDTVGYNRTFRASDSMLGALVPIGYADGYRRALAGKSWIGIVGQQAAVIGRISMDQIVARVPTGVAPAIGDRVLVLGGDPEEAAPSIAEMAEMLDTNTYEVVVGVRKRVPRVYTRNGEVIGVSDGGNSVLDD
jgi:alanine racemase